MLSSTENTEIVIFHRRHYKGCYLPQKTLPKIVIFHRKHYKGCYRLQKTLQRLSSSENITLQRLLSSTKNITKIVIFHREHCKNCYLLQRNYKDCYLSHRTLQRLSSKDIIKIAIFHREHYKFLKLSGAKAPGEPIGM